ncbi:juvenile hormone acid O-methyltransferase-like [Coccinella septempunctata]|uniref:juvenile hormone acid O-methyltransferase-like n=1 Tax=Coccinella septempunctata TaxID=41139 RepID=UPI001D0732F7|nr:juvenile hormone acid O-methyltransferase-like [Coccinella septempunctata]
MNNAKLYKHKKGLQQSDSVYVIENFSKYLRWKDQKETILDVGCGDGHTLCEILLPRIADNVEKVVGADSSRDMVEFARDEYECQNVVFEQLDVETVDVPEKFREKFDHIFSFFCLHWVIKQSVALNNIYNMLKPEGQILLTFLAKNPIYDIYEEMSKMEKWAKYKKDYRKFVSPYHNSPDPEEEVRTILKKVGFHVTICRSERRCYSFPNLATLNGSVKAVNPFLSRIPEEDHESYFEDYDNIMKRSKDVIWEKHNNNDNGKFHCFHELMIVVASKGY